MFQMILNYLKKVFITNKIITFKGDIKTLEEMVDEMLIDNNDQLFKCIKIESKIYQFIAKISIGTLRINNSHQEINLEMNILSEDENEQKIWFKGKLNPIHYFILFAYCFIFFALFISKDTLTIWLFPGIIILWVISHIWFNFIIRGQENAIIDDFNQILSKKIWRKFGKRTIHPKDRNR
jgi:hypothetical protein